MLTSADISFAANGDVLFIVDGAGLSPCPNPEFVVAGKTIDLMQNEQVKVRVSLRQEEQQMVMRSQCLCVMDIREDGSVVAFQGLGRTERTKR